MIIYDLETTGIDVLRDRIIEIYAIKINGDERSELHYILNPQIPIPPGATAIHGYTDDAVRDKPLLSSVINEIEEFFAGEDLIGYNNRQFDNLLLNVEFARHGKDLRLEERKTLDIYELWTSLEPRNLGGAYKRFCNESSDNLHGAKEDVNVLNKIFPKILETFELGGKTFEELTEIASPDERSLCFGKLLIDEDKKLKFNFGKHTGKTIERVLTEDADYLRWMLEESNTNSAIKYYILVEITRINRNNQE